MKMLLNALILCALVALPVKAATPQKKVNSKTLHVDGEFAENDQELNFLKDELKNVKNLRRGYKKKAKVYTKLTEESEQLKENFESYIGNRVEYESAINGYNKTIECLKSGDATKCRPDLSKKKQQKKRAQQRRRDVPVSMNDYPYEDSLEMGMSAPVRTQQVPQGFISEIDSRIAQRGTDLLRCYKLGGYKEQGVLKVQLKIAPNGHLSHLGYEDTTQISDPKVTRCLAQVLYSIVYPQTPNQRVTTVRKPFVFNLM